MNNKDFLNGLENYGLIERAIVFEVRRLKAFAGQDLLFPLEELLETLVVGVCAQYKPYSVYGFDNVVKEHALAKVLIEILERTYEDLCLEAPKLLETTLIELQCSNDNMNGRSIELYTEKQHIAEAILASDGVLSWFHKDFKPHDAIVTDTWKSGKIAEAFEAFGGDVLKAKVIYASNWFKLHILAEEELTAESEEVPHRIFDMEADSAAKAIRLTICRLILQDKVYLSREDVWGAFEEFTAKEPRMEFLIDEVFAKKSFLTQYAFDGSVWEALLY